MVAIAERLEETFADRPGAVGFFRTVDHKRIGKRYLVTAFLFLIAGGIQAILIRTQLIGPEQGLLTPEAYNQLMTMHGTTMIFLFNTPVLAGFGNYVMPLQIGTRDMAFPRVNALSYWIFLFSGLFMYASFLVGAVPDGGWFAYTPLTGPEYSPGMNMDFWALGVMFIGFSTTAGGINFIVTIFRMRAPGMSVNRMPLFTWSILVMGFMILFALPAITLATVFLALDRQLGMAFFDVARGGEPLLYQHLFWIWGHPEVYILVIPATGIVSEIIPTFSRRPIAGYTYVAAALVAIGFISFGVWIHHMFAAGVPHLASMFFGIASLVITIPSGVQVFAWIATVWNGKRVRWATPMLFSLGFLLIFVAGGITGVMVAAVPFDWQVHDSYFVVAHFHYVLVGGVVFPVLAGLYYWFPKMTGRLMSERLGKASFWCAFLGFNLGFFPQHILGLLGMPRRTYTYEQGLGWETLNLVSSLGAYLLAFGFLLTFVNVLWSRLRGAESGPDPWGAATLEWATTSPPPEYNYLPIPRVTSRDPLWDDPVSVAQVAVVAARGASAEHIEIDEEGAELHHQTPGTTELDGEPDVQLILPGPTSLPFWLTLAVTVLFVGFLYRNPAVIVAGALGLALSVVVWHRPAGGKH